MVPGQPLGANTGPGRLPFPNREETILPENLAREYRTSLEPQGDRFTFRYRGKDGTVEYVLSPREPFFRGIEVFLDGRKVARPWSGAGVEFGSSASD